MAHDEDDLPRHPSTKPPDFATWSVEELDAYIKRMEAEIARARAAIQAKQQERAAAEALFRRR